MSMFKVIYQISDGEEIITHKRFYSATDESIAEEMLKETWREGSLVGYERPVILKVKRVNVIEKQK